MKKLFFTAAMALLVGLTTQAKDLPFMKPSPSTVEEKLSKYRKFILPMSSASANQRISSITPDSISIYEHDGTGWDMEFTGKITYNGNAQPTRVLLYLPPPLSLPYADVVFTYNAAGRLTAMQQNIFIPVPSIQFKIEQVVNANQNVTSTKMYENDGTSLVLVSGDSAVFTYIGTDIATAEVSYYNDMTSAWEKEDRISGLQFNAAGEAIAVAFQYWDQMTSSWSIETSKYANIQWGLGYPGNDYLIGVSPISAFDLLPILPAPDYAEFTQPTTYIEWVELGSVTDTLSRVSSVSTSGRITQVLEEEKVMGNWELSSRYNYTYDTNNRIIQVDDQDHNGTAWEDDFRNTWTFDAQNNLTKEEFLYHDGISFILSGGREYEYLYTATNIPYQIITKSYDGMSYVLSEKNVYNFGSFNTAASSLKGVKLEAYPNPVVDVLTVRLENSTERAVKLSCTSLTGQLVWQEEATASAGDNLFYIPMGGLEAGVYFVKIQSASESQTIKIVK